jgi:hypothetical protein
MKLPKEICWDRIKGILQTMGIVLALDPSPSRSGSGTINGWRFRITILSEGNNAILEIEHISSANVSEDPLVKIISQEIFETGPFCMYKCQSNKGFLIIEWRDPVSRDTRYQEIDLRKDTFDLVPLGLPQ